MFCKYCGGEKLDNEKFCKKCGKPHSENLYQTRDISNLNPIKMEYDEARLQTLRLVCNIGSIIIFVIILIQSMTIGALGGIADYIGTDGAESIVVEAKMGIILALFYLIAGVLGMVRLRDRNSVKVSGIIYIIGSLLTLVIVEEFYDLYLWGWTALIFGAIHVISAVVE